MDFDAELFAVHIATSKHRHLSRRRLMETLRSLADQHSPVFSADRAENTERFDAIIRRIGPMQRPQWRKLVTAARLHQRRLDEHTDIS